MVLNWVCLFACFYILTFVAGSHYPQPVPYMPPYSGFQQPVMLGQVAHQQQHQLINPAHINEVTDDPMEQLEDSNLTTLT